MQACSSLIRWSSGLSKVSTRCGWIWPTSWLSTSSRSMFENWLSFSFHLHVAFPARWGSPHTLWRHSSLPRKIVPETQLFALLPKASLLKIWIWRLQVPNSFALNLGQLACLSLCVVLWLDRKNPQWLVSTVPSAHMLAIAALDWPQPSYSSIFDPQIRSMLFQTILLDG